MKNQMLVEIPIEDRAQVLRDSAHSVEEQRYKRYFDAEEITELNKDFVQKDQNYWRNEVEKKAIIKSLIAELKVESQAVQILRAKIRTGYEEVKGDVFLMDDQELQQMGYYDPSGRLIDQRRLKPEERQLRMNQFKVS